MFIGKFWNDRYCFSSRTPAFGWTYDTEHRLVQDVLSCHHYVYAISTAKCTVTFVTSVTAALFGELDATHNEVQVMSTKLSHQTVLTALSMPASNARTQSDCLNVQVCISAALQHTRNAQWPALCCQHFITSSSYKHAATNHKRSPCTYSQ
jgi:hypothetical protein